MLSQSGRRRRRSFHTLDGRGRFRKLENDKGKAMSPLRLQKAENHRRAFLCVWVRKALLLFWSRSLGDDQRLVGREPLRLSHAPTTIPDQSAEGVGDDFLFFVGIFVSIIVDKGVVRTRGFSLAVRKGLSLSHALRLTLPFCTGEHFSRFGSAPEGASRETLALPLPPVEKLPYHSPYQQDFPPSMKSSHEWKQEKKLLVVVLACAFRSKGGDERVGRRKWRETSGRRPITGRERERDP